MGIEFDEENKFNQAFQNESKKIGAMAKWIIDKKIAKDEKGANTILIVFAVICLALSVYFFLK